MPKLPDRWTNYTNIGNIIPNTRFITFKVPLDEYQSRGQPEEIWFTPAMLLDNVVSKGHNLGLIIDLTFTTRYYKPHEFISNGVQYEKIFVPGHIIPSQKIIRKFYSAVDRFLETAGADALVGVHCTHGVNRTGYVVCRYMIERLGVDPTEALKAYAEGRGYPVERENYVADLMSRSRIEGYDPNNLEEDEDEDETELGQDNNHRFNNPGPHHKQSHSDRKMYQERIFENGNIKHGSDYQNKDYSHKIDHSSSKRQLNSGQDSQTWRSEARQRAQPYDRQSSGSSGEYSWSGDGADKRAWRNDRQRDNGHYERGRGQDGRQKMWYVQEWQDYQGSSYGGYNRGRGSYDGNYRGRGIYGGNNRGRGSYGGNNRGRDSDYSGSRGIHKQDTPQNYQQSPLERVSWGSGATSGYGGWQGQGNSYQRQHRQGQSQGHRN